MSIDPRTSKPERRPMSQEDRDEFWRLYEANARGPIDRACQSASRRLSDRAIDTDDMIAWVDQRVWRSMEKSAWPIFHDEPSPGEAVDRVIASVGVLSRWAYLALCRKAFRRAARESEYIDRMTRAERLAITNDEAGRFESDESLSADLDTLARRLGDKTSAQVAASWPETHDRWRLAKALGATDDADDELIERATHGDMKENTVQQMRSRSRRRLIEALNEIKRSAIGLLIVGALALSGAQTFAGEQSGGRRGGFVAPSATALSGGEQGGGRGGFFAPAMLPGGGEQGGGRGG